VGSVNITFVNYNGIRTTVRGRVGQSLLEVAQQHDYEFLDGLLLANVCVLFAPLNIPYVLYRGVRWWWWHLRHQAGRLVD